MESSPSRNDRNHLESDGPDPLFSEPATRPLEFNIPPEESDCLDPLFSETAKQPLEFPNSHQESDGLDPLFSETAKQALEFPDSHEESDGLDPLFSESAKRTLESNNPPDFDPSDLWDKEIDGLDLREKVDSADNNNKKKRKNVGNKRVPNPKVSKKKENDERKAYLAQQADFQRVMRERKSVGFKPIQMVEKPISSVLAKIRQRKMEVSIKLMGSRSIYKSTEEIKVDSNEEDKDTSKFEAPVNEASKDIACSSDEQLPSNNTLVDETEMPFRPPVDDTQDLFSDSQERPLNEKSGSPAEDVSPSLSSLNLRLDSALPDDISSDEEESDKENTDLLPKPLPKDNSSGNGDHVKQFLDEEALEDDTDSDNDLDDNDGETDAEMDKHCDYIATDFKEKPIDLERRNQLHQTWLQELDEKLLQKLTKKQGPTFLEDKDEDEDEENEDEEDDDEDDVVPEDVEDESKLEHSGQQQTLSARETTEMLKQMIPKMFTDEDDGFVSSEDEETERSLSMEHLLREVELKRKTKFMSPTQDKSSKKVLGSIRKLNSVPETKKKAKTPSFFDALLSKGNSSISNKSSFLRRASSQPVPSSKRQGSSNVRSYIFGRDDSRSSTPLVEDLSNSNQTESQVKKVVSAKFSGSQVKVSTRETQTRVEKAAGTSLFDILKRSSIQTGHNAEDNMVDHQAAFASFKSVKKHIKVDRRL